MTVQLSVATVWYLAGDRELIDKSWRSCDLHFLLHLTDMFTLSEQIAAKLSINDSKCHSCIDYSWLHDLRFILLPKHRLWLYIYSMSLAVFKIFSCTRPLQSYAFCTTCCSQYYTADLINDDKSVGREKYLHCCHYIEQNQWLWAHVSLTQVLPFCCMSRIVWCENIAPCWFPFIHFQRRPQPTLTDRRRVGWSCSDVRERSLLDLTTFFVVPSTVMSQVWCHFHFCCMCSSKCIMFRICCWYMCGLHKPKHLEKLYKAKFELGWH